MSYQGLRGFIKRLEEEGELVTIAEELDPVCEVTAAIRQVIEVRNAAVLAKNIKGHTIPVAGNLYGSRRRVALALDTTEDKLIEEYLARRGKSLPPKMVDTGPVKEVIIRDGIDLPKLIPALTYHQKDVNPYITQGVVFIKDPETKVPSMGIHRMQVKGGNKLHIWLASPTAAKILGKAEQRGEPLEVAIALGAEPAVLLGCLTWLPDKIGVAGGFRGDGVELVKAETVDMEVPAHAMMVLEGKVIPKMREEDGPFGESSGYYLTVTTPVAEIGAVTHQKEPIYSVFVPWSVEDALMIELARGGDIYQRLKADVPNLQGIAIYSTNLNMVISIKKGSEMEPKRALYLLLASDPYVKHAVVVDDDVDIFNLREVLWALATRFQGDKDLIVLTDFSGYPLDPSAAERGNITAKIGFDATKPLGKEKEFEKIAVPQDAIAKAKEIVQKYLR
jgi:2,5-furandicarboxylate decarboxylase 1